MFILCVNKPVFMMNYQVELKLELILLLIFQHPFLALFCCGAVLLRNFLSSVERGNIQISE